ncbi:MAG TPA: sugar ABC transporter ATP-binding protein [Solirubrobacteraceae bacterium]
MSGYAGGAATPDALSIADVSKTFGPGRVLHSVALSVQAGAVHALVGANGAGKSVLVRCITGVYRADPGAAIAINGVSAPSTYGPQTAWSLGLRVVHQEAPVIDIMSVAELYGLYRGFPRIARIGIRWGALERRAAEDLARLDIPISPKRLGRSLSPGDRAMVMLAIALADVDAGARLLILDEATASLPVKDADRFLNAVQVAASHGVGVVLVTHRLAEVFAVAGTVTVLRDGRVAHEASVADVTYEQLVGEIVGPSREVSTLRSSARREGEGSPGPLARFAPPQRTRAGADDVVLEVDRLSGTIVEEISFSVRAGEIVGLTGIGGSGAEEVGPLIARVKRARAGQVIVDGMAVPPTAGPRQAIAAGVAYVPADRLRDGGIGALSATDNVSLPAFDSYWRHGQEERQDVDDVVRAFGVRPPQPSRAFHTFSGGNQQKLIVGKWALTRPKLFVLDDPTAGVDPGAREDLYGVLQSLTTSGTAILLISPEPEQLARLASRVFVLRGGKVAAELQGEELSVETISTVSVLS